MRPNFQDPEVRAALAIELAGAPYLRAILEHEVQSILGTSASDGALRALNATRLFAATILNAAKTAPKAEHARPDRDATGSSEPRNPDAVGRPRRRATRRRGTGILDATGSGSSAGAGAA